MRGLQPAFTVAIRHGGDCADMARAKTVLDISDGASMASLFRNVNSDITAIILTSPSVICSQGLINCQFMRVENSKTI